MENNMLRVILFTVLSICGIGNLAAEGVSYKTIKVDAPFEMPDIKECVFPDKEFKITSYGAKAKDGFINTKAINKAIRACSKAGGGKVIVPAGEWLTGPVHLMSNVNLVLAEGSVLKFIDRPEAYLPAVMTSWEGMECYNYSPLVYAYDCENVAITGKGTLAPIMGEWRKWFGRPQPHLDALKELYTKASTDVAVEERQMAHGEKHLRPHLIHLNRCKNVLLDGFRIRQSPFWTVHIYLCEGGIARNLDVNAHGHNNDGIDLEMTRNFLVENCVFDQGDDAVVIKAGRNRDAWRLATPSENIVIRNCTVNAGHTLLGIGSEISGGIRNVYMHDCVASGLLHRLFFIKTNHRRGAFVENIYMDGIKAIGAINVLEIDTEVLYQWRKLVPTYEERLTKIDGIHVSNVECGDVKRVYEIKGDFRKPVRNVSIDNVRVGCVANPQNICANVNNLTVGTVVCDSVDPKTLPQLDKYVSNK